MPKEAKSTVPKGKRTARVKKVKDPNKPKRPMTAFFIFSGDYREQVKKENPELKVGGIAKILGERWRNLSQQEKDVYQAKVDLDKKRYDLQMDSYNASNGASSSHVQSSNIVHQQQYDDDEEEESE